MLVTLRDAWHAASLRWMRSITVRNFRCFGDDAQTARLAPLTLLVGENSSGKTSLMAFVRALWDVIYGDLAPNFKEAPYDLGSFREIAHHRGARGGRADVFEGRFEMPMRARRSRNAACLSEASHIPRAVVCASARVPALEPWASVDRSALPW